MGKAKIEKSTSNRRQAFRIYEQADLVFHKIEFNQEQLNNTSFNNILKSTVQSFNPEDLSSTENTAVESFLPASYSHENKTLNVNISSTGICFTSKEAMEPGDYLMIRVLLLSSMIVIKTCCKIVYTKPSNPFEKNQYPYTIGVKFIRLKQQDKELLDNYIKKKRTRRLMMNGLLLCFILLVIQVPDLVFELITDLFSFIIDECIEVFHLLYEVIEYGLDLIIEHVFYTDMQSTQMIVFYIQSALFIALIFPIFRVVSSFCKKLFYYCQLSLYRKKSSLLYCWGEQTLLRKAGIMSLVFLLTSFFVLGLI